MKKIQTTILLGILLAPNISNGTTLKILSSEPNTIIYEVTNPMNKKSLGTAPLVMEEFDTSEPRVLLLEKPGFASSYIPISKGLASTFSIMTTLHPIINWTSEEMNRKSIETAEEIVDKINLINILVENKKYSEAMVHSENLISQYPNSVSVKITYANTLLMNGEGKKAEALYSSLINEIPESKSLLKGKIAKIYSRISGKRMPASEKGER